MYSQVSTALPVWIPKYVKTDMNLECRLFPLAELASNTF